MEVKKKRVVDILKLEMIINQNGLCSPDKPGHWKFPIKNLEEVGECKFTDVQAKRVEKVLCIIIYKALTLETSKAVDSKDVVTRITWIMATLGQGENFSDALIVTVEAKIAEWM
jgi:hypothetical protein